MSLTVAIEGCGHGELERIYESIEYIETNHGKKIDLLLCCGDFQCLRNEEDLKCLSCPEKYRSMGTFYKYYSGEKVAPVMTIFIGGNHEASNYLQELHYGGWVAPNIFYLGVAGVVNYGGLRIAGLSGIYNRHHYHLGHFEKYPYTKETLRSVYHVRASDVWAMSLLREPVDIFLSHDWPRNIARYGDLSSLLAKKEFLAQEIRNSTLGNPGTEYLLHKLKPGYWFSAHHHVKYPAIVNHSSTTTKISTQNDDANKDKDDSTISKYNKMTKFLALDKCLPHKDFLQILEFNVNSFVGQQGEEELAEQQKQGEELGGEKPLLELQVDLEWLAILKATHTFQTPNYNGIPLPQQKEQEEQIQEQVKTEILPSLEKKVSNNLAWPFPFVATAPTYTPQHTPQHTQQYTQQHTQQPTNSNKTARGNPQTDGLLQLLELPHLITTPYVMFEKEGGSQHVPFHDPDSIDVGDY